jgi:hypothetical protein
MTRIDLPIRRSQPSLRIDPAQRPRTHLTRLTERENYVLPKHEPPDHYRRCRSSRCLRKNRTQNLFGVEITDSARVLAIESSLLPDH